MTVEQFRAEQVIWGGFGWPRAGLGLFGLATGSGGGRWRCWRALRPHPRRRAGPRPLLTTQVARREERMLEEFPTVAELLALAVTAARARSGRSSGAPESAGELSKELGRRPGAGPLRASLVQALEGIAARTSLAPLARFVDGVAIAVERGTPLADVLRAQAVDVREAGKRQLLESAGRREIGMMVPVVFLVLPITIVFALFPGFYGLTLVAQ
jgi:tight adherence protein C